VRITRILLASAVLVAILTAPVPAIAATGSPIDESARAAVVATDTASTPRYAGEDASAAQVQPDPEAETGRFVFVLIPLLAAAVVAVGAVVVLARGRRRRRGD